MSRPLCRFCVPGGKGPRSQCLRPATVVVVTRFGLTRRHGLCAEHLRAYRAFRREHGLDDVVGRVSFVKVKK